MKKTNTTPAPMLLATLTYGDEPGTFVGTIKCPDGNILTMSCRDLGEFIEWSLDYGATMQDRRVKQEVPA